MFVPQPLKKLISILRGDVAPLLILISVTLGFWFGLTPGWYGIHVALLVLVLILNVHIGIFVFFAGLGKALSFAAAPALYHAGVWVQDTLASLVDVLAATPVIALTDFSQYSVCGALLLAGTYSSLEKLLIALVASFTLLTVVCTVLLQWTGFSVSWQDIAGGLSLGVPDEISTMLVLTALAMYAGTGVAFGEMWTYTENAPGTRVVNGPGDMTLLKRRSVKGWRAPESIWVLEYGRGPIPTCLPVAVGDSFFSAMDFKTFFKTFWVYAGLTLKELLKGKI